MNIPDDPSTHAVAKWLHDTYMDGARWSGWKVQEETDGAFINLPEKNKATMLYLAAACVGQLIPVLLLEDTGDGKLINKLFAKAQFELAEAKERIQQLEAEVRALSQEETKE